MFKWLTGRRESRAEETGGKELLVMSRKVPVSPDRAFAVFVDGLDGWWPRDATWGGDQVETIGIDPRVGGRCYERTRDGAEAVWGTVLTVSRPNHIVFAWQIRPDRSPEPNEAAASRVDVRFTASGPAATDVVIVHRDFPRHGEGWEAYRRAMGAANGWPRLMGLYVKAAAG
jgi:uncharacterized protein YndB with AHSA1/START domain